MLADMPQGCVPCFLLYLQYIRNLCIAVKITTTTFADDIAIWRIICSTNFDMLQRFEAKVVQMMISIDGQ